MSQKQKLHANVRQLWLFLTVGFIKASSNDQTLFVAVFNIRENGQMKLTVVIKQKEKGFVFQSCRRYVLTWFSLFLLWGHLQQAEPREQNGGSSRPMSCSRDSSFSWRKRFLCAVVYIVVMSAGIHVCFVGNFLYCLPADFLSKCTRNVPFTYVCVRKTAVIAIAKGPVWYMTLEKYMTSRLAQV